MAGSLIESLVVPEDRQRILDAYCRLLEERRGTIDIAVRVPRPDGSIGLFMATLTDMLDDPDVQGIVWNYSAVQSAEPDPLKTAPA